MRRRTAGRSKISLGYVYKVMIINQWEVSDKQFFRRSGEEYKCRTLLHLSCKRTIPYWNFVKADNFIFYCPKCGEEAPNEIKQLIKMAIVMDKL